MLDCINGFAHKDTVFGLAINQDGKLLAPRSGDKTVKLRSLPEGLWLSCLMDLAAGP
jgi:hypothetical protein